MRVLHISKTSDGGRWAALQAGELVRAGVEVDVALPSLEGRSMDLWRATGARLHEADLRFPVTRPWLVSAVIGRLRRLADRVQPDLMHSHFVSTTLTLRAAFGRQAPVPRMFQVPGPLHMEHWLWRMGDIASAGSSDHWIASSRYTRDLYLGAGVPDKRVFLSYYSTEMHPPVRRIAESSSHLRARWGVPRDALVVGNINLFYKPKRYLGQFTGLKGHEDVIEALRIVMSRRTDVYGVLAGGAWGKADRYFETIRARAAAVAPGRIVFPGLLEPRAVPEAWAEFDCAVHVPLSENCGGVVEPLLAGVPVVAGRVGGLQEVVIHGVTGVTVPPRNPRELARAILAVLDDHARHRAMAKVGGRLARHMFSARRTASEIKRIYEHVLGNTAERPSDFDSDTFARGETGEETEGYPTLVEARH